ncbi:MAG: LamG-like jellyroll fold domain-containing protein [Planctomycetota bacterium]
MSSKYEFQELVQRYADGQASAAEVERLCQELRHSAEARHSFITLMNLESALEAISAEWVAAHPLIRPTVLPPRPRVWVRKRYLVGFAVCLTLLMGNLWWESYKNRVYATVENGTGVRELTNGAQLRDEWIEIARGTVEFITPTAARIVIEAPATFRFESAQRLNMTRGRLAADIPRSARKFTVVTPSGEAVDLGTKFGVDVPQSSEAEIHVFQGEVIAQSSNGGKRRNLHTGEAFQLKSGAGAVRGLRSAAFIRPEEIDSLHAALGAGQPLRSDEALLKLRQDPALIALLDFESDNSPDGVYDSVQGRWPGSRSAEFVRPGDHIRLNLGARAWPQLTLAAWVRLNQFGKSSQSLLYTDSRKHKTDGQVQWIVTDQKATQLMVSGNVPSAGSDLQSTSTTSDSPVLWEQGRWVHLAAVYDTSKRRVRFYLNGKSDGETTMKEAHPPRLGQVEIGNGDQIDRKLSGRIDEFLLLGRAMGDAEIRQLYQDGNPYR